MFPYTGGLLDALRREKEQKENLLIREPSEMSSGEYGLDINERKRKKAIMDMLQQAGMGDIAQMMRVTRE